MIGDSSIPKCSFCGKGQKKVKKLIAGPGVFICNECIELCNDILQEEVAGSPERSLPEEEIVSVPDESLVIRGRNSPFTPREALILYVMAQGLSLEKTARMLGVAHSTVRGHLANIRTKLQLIEEGGGHDETSEGGSS